MDTEHRAKVREKMLAGCWGISLLRAARVSMKKSSAITRAPHIFFMVCYNLFHPVECALNRYFSFHWYFFVSLIYQVLGRNVWWGENLWKLVKRLSTPIIAICAYWSKCTSQKIHRTVCINWVLLLLMLK